ncbi:MAG: hypothetical protein IJ575_09680 [Selenomonadaceae bacterium]|nr:hypothetical protein [Selenomonadaceae bacterium]
MAIVRVKLKDLPPRTEADRQRVLEAAKRPIVYDPDCPPPTEEEIAETEYLMKKYKTRRLTKEMYIAEGFIKPKSK